MKTLHRDNTNFKIAWQLHLVAKSLARSRITEVVILLQLRGSSCVCSTTYSAIVKVRNRKLRKLMNGGIQHQKECDCENSKEIPQTIIF